MAKKRRGTAVVIGGFNFEVPLKASGFHLADLEEDSSTIYLLTPDLRIGYCNRAWDKFAFDNGGVGLNREAVLGKEVLEVTAEPLKAFYERGFAQAEKQLRLWEHDYECSSPELFRTFHMRVLPLVNSYLLVENSLRVERLHERDRPAISAGAHSYVSAAGILAMCAHCRRTQRAGTGDEPVWDWVPAFLIDPPGRVSHGLCRSCQAYFYSSS